MSQKNSTNKADSKSSDSQLYVNKADSKNDNKADNKSDKMTNTNSTSSKNSKNCK